MPKVLKDDVHQMMIETMGNVYPLAITFLKTEATNIGDWLKEVPDNIIEKYVDHKPWAKKQKKSDKEKDQDLLQCLLFMNQDIKKGESVGLTSEDIYDGAKKLVFILALESLARSEIIERPVYVEKWNLDEKNYVQTTEKFQNATITHGKKEITVTFND